MTDSALTTTQYQGGFLTDTSAFDHLWRVAKAFSLSGMVPAHFQGKPESCMVALMYAEQLGEHPMVLFQELTVINGRPGMSARYAIARANKSGLLAGPITWTEAGDGEALAVTASATLRETGEVISATVTMAEAVADGWTRNPKYKSIPGQMLRWRSATRLINLYIPETLFGLGVREESEVKAVRVSVEDTGGNSVADLNRQIAAAPTPYPQPGEAEALSALALGSRANAPHPNTPAPPEPQTPDPEPVTLATRVASRRVSRVIADEKAPAVEAAEVIPGLVD